MEVKKIQDTATVVSRKLIKGTLLVFWIVSLVYLALIAASGNILDLFKGSLGESPVLPVREKIDFTKYHWASEHYEWFVKEIKEESQRDIPIDLLLEQIFETRKWNDCDEMVDAAYASKYNNFFIVNLAKKGIAGDSALFLNYKSQIMEFNEWRKEQYFNLFRKAQNLLVTPVFTETANLTSLSVPRNFYPSVFISSEDGELRDRQISVNEYIRNWVSRQIELQRTLKRRNELINIFFLLIALGAFGSLIFLTKDFIDKESQTTVEAYIFRPFLGMFLGMGMFILDLLAHVVISKSSILEIRPEPLYLLALASGLLSEQAYEIMSIRAKRILERVKDKNPEKGGSRTE